MNGTSIALDGRSAVIDTGTTYLYGSFADVERLWSTVPGSGNLSDTHGPAYNGYHTFPCDASPVFELRFGNTDFAIAKEALSLGRVAEGSEMCVGSIVGWKSSLGSTWLVGDVFLRNVFTVFDVGSSRVGFATPSTLPTAAEISSPP
jgi:cathepsin D